MSKTKLCVSIDVRLLLCASFCASDVKNLQKLLSKTHHESSPYNPVSRRKLEKTLRILGHWGLGSVEQFQEPTDVLSTIASKTLEFCYLRGKVKHWKQ